MIRKLTDDELRESGVEPHLIDLRRAFNDRIAAGFNVLRGVTVERAFVSNPHGYDKVFVLASEGSIFEHGLSPDELVR